ncbi:MAG: MATE family efflux transporter [Pseudobutyrivibrio sp.]|nr:MATE family efflux transporter [Pseudobutyrivibrio sp.]
MKYETKRQIKLFFPICLETLCFMLAGMVDTLMLSSVSDEAVGAVGTANTYINMFIMMFAVITTGMNAVMAQYIGAGRPGVAFQAKQIGLTFNIILGTGLSLFMFFFSGNLLDAIGIASGLHEYAKGYLEIVGSFTFINASLQIYSGYLRSFGHTKQPLLGTLSANILNIILNSIFLFYFHYGVIGVAIATVISRILNLTIVVICSKKLIHAGENPERIKNLDIVKMILKVGLPSAMESFMYSLSMTLIVKFLNTLGDSGIHVTARAYAIQICNFANIISLGLAQANAIMTGWRIGAKQFEECDKATKKSAILAVCISAGVETVFALLSGIIVGIFTDDPMMISLVSKLLYIDIILEIGRATNIVYVNALKASGDAIFPSVMGMIFMLSVAAGGTWIFGVQMGMGAVGAYIGMASDECIRAVAMYFRWKTGKWRNHGLVKPSINQTSNAPAA